ncbi:polysaccharide biosynthesis/export family protein, partial [Rhodovulum sp.]|uniref:polysaccharide biosynthesis/export family protein n=1 Tax=Rhodovulum sp. TaxID=34009 RepID=UPI00185B6D66
MLYLKRILTGLVLALMAAATTTEAVAQQEYRVRPGDTLTIEVLEDTSLNRAVVVLPDGRISFPFAGSVQVGGRTVAEIERAITAGIGPNFAVTPNVFVSAQPGDRAAYATGAARSSAMDIYFL